MHASQYPKSTTVYLGTEYGGWPVIGKLLNEQSVVLSFGLGEDVSFDIELIERFGSDVHGFDPTPKSRAWLAKQNLPSQFQIHNVGLAAKSGVLTFTAPSAENFASWSATHREGPSEDVETVALPVESLEAVCERLQLSDIDVLKMDIEGSENEVIESLESSKIRPAQILVEFHHRIHRTDFSRTKKAVETLESMGYRLFYVSDLGDEFAFVLEESVK